MRLPFLVGHLFLSFIIVIYCACSCTTSVTGNRNSEHQSSSKINYSGLYHPKGSSSITRKGGHEDLPAGYIYTGPELSTLDSIDPASEDEKAITTKYFEVCEKLLGEFPLPEISCDDPDMIPLPIERTVNGKTTVFEASDLPPAGALLNLAAKRKLLF
jgi:hypothetical protein